MVSLSERLTAQFYDWEKLGRGWHVFDDPVDLEPEFYPFFFHEVNVPQKHIDDGKVPNIFGRIANLFSKPQEQEEEPESIPVNGYIFDCDEPLITFSITLPKGYKVEIDETEQLLVMLSGSQYPISFEILASGDSISFQIACRESDAAIVAGQIKAYFPESAVKQQTDLLNVLADTVACASIWKARYIS